MKKIKERCVYSNVKMYTYWQNMDEYLLIKQPIIGNDCILHIFTK